MGACHVCAGGELHEFPQYASLSRVTSDCRPWPSGGRLVMCDGCGSVQKIIDGQWQAEVDGIYASYSLYFQSAGGAEQAVFTAGAPQPVFRSDRLVSEVIRHGALPARGRLLDIGCGNGAFLRAFSRALPGWTLAGTELSDATRTTVESIPRVEALYTCPLAETPGPFTVVSLVHVLEHIAHLPTLLAAVAEKLEPGGLLFVEVPSSASNPFDLLIADHASHFTRTSLTGALEAAGFRILTASETWVSKELSVLAVYDGARVSDGTPAGEDRDQWVPGALNWLLSVRASARTLRAGAGARPFGLFGSSIAATWLAQELDCAMTFFVDEDASRQGMRFMGRPVVSPSEVPAGSTVFVGIGGGLAAPVALRLTEARPSVSWVPAPALA